jgi:hypothetical protein
VAVRIVIGELIGMRLAHPAGSAAMPTRLYRDRLPLSFGPLYRESAQRKPATAREQLAPFEE